MRELEDTYDIVERKVGDLHEEMYPKYQSLTAQRVEREYYP